MNITEKMIKRAKQKEFDMKLTALDITAYLLSERFTYSAGGRELGEALCTLESIDAMMFSGDVFHLPDNVEMLERYMERWTRQLKVIKNETEHDHNDRNTSAFEGTKKVRSYIIYTAENSEGLPFPTIKEAKNHFKGLHGNPFFRYGGDGGWRVWANAGEYVLDDTGGRYIGAISTTFLKVEK